MIIYDAITKSYNDIDKETLKLNVFRGIVETLLEKAINLKKREEVILERAYIHFKNLGYFLKEGAENNKAFLIKKSIKYIYPISREMDDLILDLSSYAKVFVRKDYVIEDIKSIIKDSKVGKAYIPNLIVVEIPSKNEYTVKEYEIPRERKEFKIRKEEIAARKDLEMKAGFIIMLNNKKNINNLDSYTGSLFPLSDANLQILRGLLVQI